MLFGPDFFLGYQYVDLVLNGTSSLLICVLLAFLPRLSKTVIEFKVDKLTILIMTP